MFLNFILQNFYKFVFRFCLEEISLEKLLLLFFLQDNCKESGITAFVNYTEVDKHCIWNIKS